MANYKFAAVGTPAEVATLLQNRNADKARVAAVGQEGVDKKFNVWYTTSSHNENWHFKEVQLDLASDVDTKAVTAETDKSDLAAVTFYGQDKKYYIWWRS